MAHSRCNHYSNVSKKPGYIKNKHNQIIQVKITKTKHINDHTYDNVNGQSYAIVKSLIRIQHFRDLKSLNF